MTPRYLNLDIILSPPQLEFVENGSRLFDEPVYTEGVLQCGQGSGKDTCSVFLCLRVVYLLQCLKSPQRYFKMGGSSYIDIINIAPNARSAKGIFFDTAKSYIRNSPWFQNLKRSAEVNNDIYRETNTEIEFPKNIRFVSSNSNNEAFQGYTPIVAVLDEIDAFKSELELQTNRGLRKTGAEGMYNTAISLVGSRFPGAGKVLSLSWPRFRGSFIQRRFMEGKDEDRTYVAQREDGRPYATWDFNPSRSRDEYDDFYRRDPTLARAQFECDPGYAADAFFKEPKYVLDAFDGYFGEYEQILWKADKPIRSLSMLKKKVNYYIHVDLGLVDANAALCITHRVGEKIVIDRLEVWNPPIGGKEIDISGIEAYIIGLKKEGYNIIQCTYDSYQSAQTLQNLERAGMLASKKSVDRTAEAYHTLKDVIQNGNLDGYFDEDAITELLSLDILMNNKVDKRPGMLKDRADAIAGSVHNAVLSQGTLRMKGISDINDIFIKEELEENNETIFDSNTGTISPKLNKQGYIQITEACVACGDINALEFMGFDGSRTTNPQEAYRVWCFSCDDRRILGEENWIVEGEDN